MLLPPQSRYCFQVDSEVSAGSHRHDLNNLDHFVGRKVTKHHTKSDLAGSIVEVQLSAVGKVTHSRARFQG
jgi:hypothetical protein